jgi:hypothetical protein
MVEQELNQIPDERLKEREAEFKKEKFELFLGGVLSAINQSIDGNKYEDFTRSILGSKAYLMFAFDKLLISVNYILYLTFTL